MNFTPGTAGQPTADIELTLSCRELIRQDILSKSDPMCVTFVQPFAEKRWVEYHRTECINNCHDPDFVSKVKIPYRFEEQQNLKFVVYDIDSPSPRLEDHDFLGEAQCTLGQRSSSIRSYVSKLDDHDFLGEAKCTLGQVVATGTSKIPLRGKPGDTTHRGYLLVVADEVSSVKDDLILQFSGIDLDKKGWFGRSDPFLAFFKSTEGGAYSLVHKTEVVRWNTNPKWKKFTIPSSSFCSGDLDRNIKVTCWHSSMAHSSNLIGEFYVTVNELSKGPSEDTIFTIVNPEKQKKPKYSSSGRIRLEHFEVLRNFSFIEYIKGGCQLNCSIAIDFTGSNGDPVLPASLHYISSEPNLYEQAIISVGSIIQDYDSDKQFPVLGFGARLPPDGRVSHEFFVNMDQSNPYCNGINGVLTAYRSCIRQVQLYGPTNFAPVINHAAKFAAAYRDGSNYFTLLILTDGIISDLPQTTKAIVDASMLPLSIIIVGVGNADFSAMEVLDADTVPLISNGRHAARDIVQFVPLNKHVLTITDRSVARTHLAREVLAEIPRQFLSFMKSNNIKPRPPLSDTILLPPDPEIILSMPGN